MKNVKKLSLILALSLLASCLLGVSAFSGDKAIEKDYFEINTDILYAKIPDDFEFDPYGSMNYLETYYFSDYELSSIQFLVLENNKAPNGITSVSNAQAVEIVEDYYGAQCSYVIENAKVSKATVNGISALRIDGAFSFYPFDSADYKEDEYYYGMCAYLLATKENIFVIVYESWYEEVEIEDFEEVISTVLINGTYFDGDKLTVNHDFSSAPAYRDATIADAKEFDENWDDSFYDDDIFGEEAFGVFEEDFSAIVIVVCIFTLILPTVIFIILAIVFGVKYNKNKKKLEQYEARYGFKGLNYYNNPNPVQPDIYGYNQQSYSAQGYNGQPYGAQGYNAPQQQPNMYQQPASTPVSPVDTPTSPTEIPTPPQDPTVNSQTVSNLAPELQDSQADENK